ncbi:MAG: tRNA (adenosine(37)-N6)-threonylcarbamoyltransferase complex dimerization subunit type 1 TsaB [Pleurocapsa sp.]
MTNKYALALHTTTPQLGIAIDNFQSDRRQQIWDLDRDLSSHVHQCLQEIIQPQTWQDLAFVAVAKGPGGFTGTRVGVTIARTLGQQLDIPVFGISNLAAIALFNCPDCNCDTLLAVQMKARKNNLFVGIYQPTLSDRPLATYLPDSLMTSANWQQTLDNLPQPYQLIKAEGDLAMSVTSILKLAYLEWQQGKSPQWSEVVPFYGQHPVG